MALSSDNEAIVAISTTIPRFFKGASDETIRQRLWLSLLRKRNRIMPNAGTGGTSMVGTVQYAQPPMKQMGDAGDLDFSVGNYHKNWSLPWRGYIMTDRVTKKQALMNRGPQQIVDVMGDKLDIMKKGFQASLGSELYGDGNASGKENAYHGIESLCGDDGTTVATDLIANPSDSYAGLSTGVTSAGGSWTSGLSTKPNATLAIDWPRGKGSAETGYYSPILANVSSTNWNTGGTDFRSNCEIVMRRVLAWNRALTNGSPYAFMTNPDWLADFKDFMSTRNRNITPNPDALELGFPGALQFEGAMIYSEIECPADTAYGLNIDEMELRLLSDDLMDAEGPTWDQKSQSYLFTVGNFGNLHFNPRHFAKLAYYA